MNRAGRVAELPAAEENAAINAGIAADPNATELDAEWFAGARPARQLLREDVYATLVAMKRPPGRPGLRINLDRHAGLLQIPARRDCTPY